MDNTYPDTDRNGQIEAQATCPPRKVSTESDRETGQESPSPVVAALIVLGLVALGLGPMALGSLLPSWAVLGPIAVWVVYRFLRGER